MDLLRVADLNEAGGAGSIQNALAFEAAGCMSPGILAGCDPASEKCRDLVWRADPHIGQRPSIYPADEDTESSTVYCLERVFIRRVVSEISDCSVRSDFLEYRLHRIAFVPDRGSDLDPAIERKKANSIDMLNGGPGS